MTGYWVVLTTLLLGVLALVVVAVTRRRHTPVAPPARPGATDEPGADHGRAPSPAVLRSLALAVPYVVLVAGVVYLFAWALVLRSGLGPAALVAMAVFVGVLGLGLTHVWRRARPRWR